MDSTRPGAEILTEPALLHPVTTRDLPRWRGSVPGWFAGATWVVTVLGVLSIGIFVLPVAITLTVVLATRRTSSVGLPGIISGVGLPLLYIAYLNRGGPGNVCTKSALGESCTQEWSPWPWLAFGMALLAVGIVVFAERKAAKSPWKVSS